LQLLKQKELKRLKIPFSIRKNSVLQDCVIFNNARDEKRINQNFSRGGFKGFYLKKAETKSDPFLQLLMIREFLGGLALKSSSGFKPIG